MWSWFSFVLGFVVSSVIDLIYQIHILNKKTTRFFELSCEAEEPYLEDKKAHYEYACSVAPGYDYFLWSFCPYRNQFETPKECKIWNCPGCAVGSSLQCKGLKHSCVELPNSSFYEFCSDVEEKRNEPDF